MKFVSWNVNGLRAIVKKGFDDIFREFDADVFAIQETKLQEGQSPLDFGDYHEYWKMCIRDRHRGAELR